VKLIHTRRFGDNRDWFRKSWNQAKWSAQGTAEHFVQDYPVAIAPHRHHWRHPFPDSTGGAGQAGALRRGAGRGRQSDRLLSFRWCGWGQLVRPCQRHFEQPRRHGGPAPVVEAIATADYPTRAPPRWFAFQYHQDHRRVRPKSSSGLVAADASAASAPSAPIGERGSHAPKTFITEVVGQVGMRQADEARRDDRGFLLTDQRNRDDFYDFPWPYPRPRQRSAQESTQPCLCAFRQSSRICVGAGYPKASAAGVRRILRAFSLGPLPPTNRSWSGNW